MAEKKENILLTPDDKKSRRVGLLAAVAFHLLLAVIFLALSIRSEMRSELLIEADPDEVERLKEEILKQKETIKQIAERQLAEAMRSAGDYKNIAVNDDAKEGSETPEPEEFPDEGAASQKTAQVAVDLEKHDPSKEEAAKESDSKSPNASYKGPSLLNWSLEGRRAYSLPVPVYRCRGGGDVTVQISVARNGYVKNVSVVAGGNLEECIVKAALSAAKKSRFSASSTAPNPQIGQITYRFISQ